MRTFAAPFRHMDGTLPALLSRSGSIIMAVLLNIISSGSRKSAGAATFRRVRGRTIMSQKRGGLSKSAMETRAAEGLVRTYREAMFYIVTSFCAGMAQSINASFEPTRYGSSRNAFFKLNYSFIESVVNGTNLGLALLDQLMHDVSFTGVQAADGEIIRSISEFNIAGFNALCDAKEATGSSLIYVRATRPTITHAGTDEAWNASDDPTGTTISSFEVSVTPATSSGQKITAVRVTSSTNFTPSAEVVVVVQGQIMQGSWSGNTFNVTDSPYYSETHTVIIRTTANVVLAQRNVTFFSNSTEASGE